MNIVAITSDIVTTYFCIKYNETVSKRTGVNNLQLKTTERNVALCTWFATHGTSPVPYHLKEVRMNIYICFWIFTFFIIIVLNFNLLHPPLNQEFAKLQ